MAENADKLVIVRGKFRGANVDFPPPGGDSTFTVCFNPTEYTIAKKASYAEAAIPGLDSPMLQFSRGEARTLSVELMLDTCTYDDGRDVRSEYLEPLESFLLVDGELHAPPPCKVVWGSLEFVGVPESLSTRFVLFKDDGTPVRVRATLSFKEYIPVQVQLAATPRSSPDRRKLHVVQSGDSLWQLAYEAYGDPARWRAIAEANGMDQARALSPGAALVIPALPPHPGVFAHGR